MTTEFGYAGKILMVDLSTEKMTDVPTAKYADKYIGGLGIATKLCDRYGINSNCYLSMLFWLGLCFKMGVLNEENTGLPFSKLGSLEFMEILLKMMVFREGFGDILAEGIDYATAKVGGRAHQVTKMLWGWTIFNPRKVVTVGVFDPRLVISTGAILATSPRQRVCKCDEIGHMGGVLLV